MNDRVKGFILSESDYKDSDKILQVLTREYGVLSFVAKGAKKVSGKNRFFALCLYEFIIDYKDGHSIFSIHSAKLLSSYFEEKDLKLYAYKAIFAQAVLKTREFADEQMFDHLLFVYEHMEQKEYRYCLGCMFFVYLIKLFGITPYVDGCVICDRKQVVSLSSRHGGFLCLEHLGTEEKLDVITLKKFRLMVKGTFENYDLMKDYEYSEKDFSLFVNFFLSNTEIRLPSVDFFSKM